ncbi:CACTA en-spm transposon protein [Cucumis melo var. makuwa]|uniref:CACTA en-spm transposon protein n=1 Tax=Cucumis melo var. makuwa TaxID=1194695 RepID=A0A5D3C5G9_CUCMM|nr:CACTA en-spm transposon protein [Cucumis melo var. makuwa]
MSTCTMSSFPSDFDETDVMFLEFTEDLNNHAGGSSSMEDNLGDVRKHSRLLELDFYVHANGRISMSIAPGAEEPILPHVVRFSQTIDMCVKKTFLVCCLRWAYVRREYIEVVKGDLQRFLFLISTITMDRFVENQVLNTFKEFRGDCYRHFKKYDPEEARANLPHILVGHMED